MRGLFAASLLVLAGALGCTDVDIEAPLAPSPTTPVVTRDRVEYRASGTSATVLIRYATADDGLTQLQTTLPFSVQFINERPSTFLSVEATPVSTAFVNFPFLSVQIYVNGTLFREASSTTYGTVAATGTWRR